MSAFDDAKKHAQARPGHPQQQIEDARDLLDRLMAAGDANAFLAPEAIAAAALLTSTTCKTSRGMRTSSRSTASTSLWIKAVRAAAKTLAAGGGPDAALRALVQEWFHATYRPEHVRRDGSLYGLNGPLRLTAIMPDFALIDQMMQTAGISHDAAVRAFRALIQAVWGEARRSLPYGGAEEVGALVEALLATPVGADPNGRGDRPYRIGSLALWHARRWPGHWVQVSHHAAWSKIGKALEEHEIALWPVLARDARTRLEIQDWTKTRLTRECAAAGIAHPAGTGAT